MALNPMQRKARNSFLLGMFSAIVVAGLIIAILFMQLIKLKEEEQEKEATITTAIVLTSDVKSGGQITFEVIKEVDTFVEATPSNAITMDMIEENTIAKIALTSGTILTEEMIETTENKTENDLRLQEYNMLILPSYLEVGDYVDIRLTLPTGQDYIVVSKKEVKQTSETSPTTLWLEMSEAEILTMSNAIVEAYTMKGSNLYATLYVEPGLQEQASITYPVSVEISKLIERDPNITQTAREAIWAKYNAVIEERTGTLTNVLSQYEAERTQNIEEKVTIQIEKQQAERQQYLDSLSGEDY